MTQQVRLDHLAVAVVVIVIFAIVGYRRGILRELVAAPALLIAPYAGPWLGPVLAPWANRYYKLLLFARYGGLTSDDLAAVMDKVGNVPPLVDTAEQIATLGSVCFLGIIALGYALGQWRVAGPGDRVARLLGAVMGGINGYMLVRTLVPRFLTAQFTVIVVPTAGVTQLLQAQTAAVLVVAFVVLVAFGLERARRK